MGNSSTTETNIPDEYKPLARNTADIVTNWQNWVTGGFPGFNKTQTDVPGMNYNFNPNSGQWENTQITEGAPMGGGGNNGGGSKGPNTSVGAGSPSMSFSSRLAKSLSGGGSGTDKTASAQTPYQPVNDIVSPGVQPPPTDKPPTDARGGNYPTDTQFGIPENGQKTSYINNSSYPAFPLDQVLSFNPMLDGLGLSDWQKTYGDNIGKVLQRPNAEGEANNWAFANFNEASKVPTGDSILNGNNQTLANALKVWNDTNGNEINNDAALAGLGNSNALLNSRASSRNQFISPFIENQLGREERAISRGQQARETGINTLLTTGGRESDRLNQAMADAWQMGGAQQDANKAQRAATLGERDRFQKMFEQAMWQPMGNFIPSSFGSTTTSK